MDVTTVTIRHLVGYMRSDSDLRRGYYFRSAIYTRGKGKHWQSLKSINIAGAWLCMGGHVISLISKT
jgi:hypothetical protein